MAVNIGLERPKRGMRLEQVIDILDRVCQYLGQETEGLSIAHADTTGQTANDHHNKQHALDSAADHTGDVVENNLMDADASGLPDDSGLAVADVSDAVTKKHDRQHAINATADHTSTIVQNRIVIGDANGLPSDSGLSILGGAMKVLCNNDSGSSISNNAAVFVSGWNASGYPNIRHADKDSTTQLCFGLINADIANGATGYVVVAGPITGVNTSGFSAGDILYLTDTGAYSATPPTAGSVQPIGRVEVSHASNGVITVFSNAGWWRALMAAASGMLKSNGITLSAAVAGTDYLASLPADTMKLLTFDMTATSLTASGVLRAYTLPAGTYTSVVVMCGFDVVGAANAAWDWNVQIRNATVVQGNATQVRHDATGAGDIHVGGSVVAAKFTYTAGNSVDAYATETTDSATLTAKWFTVWGVV